MEKEGRLSGSGFRVRPWGVLPFDSVGKLHLNEKLEMRNAKWWCGAKNNEAPRSINRAMPEPCLFPPSFGRRCPEGAEVGLGLFSPSTNPLPFGRSPSRGRG